jgi:hypothetical protein
LIRRRLHCLAQWPASNEGIVDPLGRHIALKAPAQRVVLGFNMTSSPRSPDFDQSARTEVRIPPALDSVNSDLRETSFQGKNGRALNF